MARNIRTGDQVQVISGSSRGQTGKVLRILDAKASSDQQRVVVEGVNVRVRNIRKSQANPQGGRVRSEQPVHISNVLPLDSDGKPTRVRFETRPDGSKWRVAATNGQPIGEALKKAR